MRFYCFMLLAFLAVTNAAITTFHKANTYHHSFSNNAFNAKTQSKTNYKASSSIAGKEDKVLRNEMEMKNDGSYHYQYETSNGISGMEHGLGGVSVQGASSYISPEGVEVKMTYTADENGYHPVGDHIPKVPDYILRALEYIRTHPPKENDDYKKSSNSYGLIKKSPSAPARKILTNIAPPTYKPAARKLTPTTKRFNSFGSTTNKFNTKTQYKNKRY